MCAENIDIFVNERRIYGYECLYLRVNSNVHSFWFNKICFLREVVVGSRRDVHKFNGDENVYDNHKITILIAHAIQNITFFLLSLLAKHFFFIFPKSRPHSTLFWLNF